MRKDRIAEWILVLVTSRERAASIVGDMMESAATHGRVWFWSSVLRAAASLLWHGFAANPRGLLGLAFHAWLVGLLLGFGVFVCAISGVGLYPRLPLAESTAMLSRAVYIADLVGMALAQFLVGCWIARRAPGRELSAWFALLIMDQILNALPSIVGLALGHPVSMRDGAWQPLTWIFVSNLSCLAGTIWVRRRSVT